MPVPTKGYSAGDLALFSVLPELPRRQGLAGRTPHTVSYASIWRLTILDNDRSRLAQTPTQAVLDLASG